MHTLTVIVVTLISTFVVTAADLAYPTQPQRGARLEVTKPQGDPRGTAPAVLTGPITNSVTGHYYYLLTANDWTNSEAKAVSLGGHLVTISDEPEHEWVSATFGLPNNTARALWIGLNARFKTNTFEWSNREAVSYTNWRPNAPNNDRPGNYFVLILPGGFPYAGRWADSSGNVWGMWSQGTGHVGVYGVVEIDPQKQPEKTDAVRKPGS